MNKLILRIVLLAAFCFLTVGIANAQVDIGYKILPSFGPVGIAYGQGAKLTTYVDRVDLDLFPPGPCTPDPTGAFPPGPCKQGPWRVTLMILSGDGTVLDRASFSLGLGENASLNFTHNDVPFAPIRKRIRPVVVVDPDENGLIPCIKQTFELTDNSTQRTVIAYQGGDNLMEGMSMSYARMSSGFVGVAGGQTARLNVVNTTDFFPINGFPPGPCRATLNLYDDTGRLIASRSFSLDPGRAGSLDWVAPANSGRVAVRAEVIVDPDSNGLVPCLMPTLEVFDNRSGNTNFLIGLL